MLGLEEQRESYDMDFSRRELMKTVGAGALAFGAGPNSTAASSSRKLDGSLDFSVI